MVDIAQPAMRQRMVKSAMRVILVMWSISSCESHCTTSDMASLNANSCLCALSIAVNHTPSSWKSVNIMVPSLSGS